jgi:hypothetical protein
LLDRGFAGGMGGARPENDRGGQQHVKALHLISKNRGRFRPATC